MGGVQKRKRIVDPKPAIPLAIAEVKIPRAAVVDAFFVSSATCPLASKPIKGPVASEEWKKD